MGDDYGKGQCRHHGDDADYLRHDSHAGPDRRVDVGHHGCLLGVERVGLPVGSQSSDCGTPPRSIGRPEPAPRSGS